MWAYNTCSFGNQAKQRCPVLEDQLVDMVVLAMERSEHDEITGDDDSQLLWQHISSQLIFFVLFQFASFPHMVMSLNEKVGFGLRFKMLYLNLFLCLTMCLNLLIAL